MNEVQRGQVAWPRSHSQRVTPLGNDPGQFESYTQTVSETHHKSGDTTHAHVNVCPLGSQGPATLHTPSHSLSREPPRHTTQAHGTTSSRNTTFFCAGLTPSSVTTPPPRPKKAGRCMPSSTPTALVLSLPPQAPAITLTPMLWKRPGSHRTSVLGGHPHSVQMVRFGPGNGHHPGHGSGAGTWAESGAWLPWSGQPTFGAPSLAVSCSAAPGAAESVNQRVQNLLVFCATTDELGLQPGS